MKNAKTEEILTREDLSFALMRIFAAGAKGAGEGYHEKVMAHDAAQRAALTKAEEAIERLYFAANWHPDRTVDADALWSAIRDAAGITPGQTASRVGPDRGCEQRNAAEARLSEIVKSLAAAVTTEENERLRRGAK